MMDFTDINSTEAQEWIQLYVNKELKGTELQSFETALSTNEALAGEVSFSKQMVFNLKNKALIDLKFQLKDIADNTAIEADYSGLDGLETNPNAGTGFTAWKGLLLGVLVIGSVLGVYFATVGLPAKQISMEQRTEILTEYLSPLENVLVQDENFPGPMIDGMQAYNEENYEAAIKNLSLIPADDNAKLYLSIAKLLNKDAVGAIQLLEELSQSPIPAYQNPAKWYLALAYLKVNRIRDAENLLQQLKIDATYGTKASALLQDLD